MSFVPIPGDDDDDGGGGGGPVDLTNYSGLNIKLTSTEDSGSGIELEAAGADTGIVMIAPGVSIQAGTSFGANTTEAGGVVSLSTAGGSALQATDDDVIITSSATGAVSITAGDSFTVEADSADGTINLQTNGEFGSINLNAMDADSGAVWITAADFVQISTTESTSPTSLKLMSLNGGITFTDSNGDYPLHNMKGFVNHGATAATARPSGFASVEWYGSVEPDNAIDGDTWIDTSA